MMKVALAAAAALLAGCSVSFGDDPRRAEMEKIQYWRDPEAGVCFAEYRLDHGYGHVVNVPCTDGVVAVALRFSAGSRQ
jgi:hypothetical protein